MHSLDEVNVTEIFPCNIFNIYEYIRSFLGDRYFKLLHLLSSEISHTYLVLSTIGPKETRNCNIY